MGIGGHFRQGNPAKYTAEQPARCKACNETRTFFRSPNDPKLGLLGHVKHLFCYYCKRITAHVQIGAQSDG